jgi:hypothetical protein
MTGERCSGPFDVRHVFAMCFMHIANHKLRSALIEIGSAHLGRGGGACGPSADGSPNATYGSAELIDDEGSM